jgi:hypothetical protein
MSLHPMQPQLFSIFEGDELLRKAIFIVADVMRYLVMCFQLVVVFIVSVSFLLAADMAEHML